MSGSLAENIGTVARAARGQLGLTQAEVAQRVELARLVYSRLERGKMLPSVPTLVRLCLALQLSPRRRWASPLTAQTRKGVTLEKPRWVGSSSWRATWKTTCSTRWWP